jgi:hypothetical protein
LLQSSKPCYRPPALPVKQRRAQLLQLLQQHMPKYATINQSVNQLHVFPAREKPRKGSTPKPQSVIPNRWAQTHKLGPDTAKTINAQALA